MFSVLHLVLLFRSIYIYTTVTLLMIMTAKKSVHIKRKFIFLTCTRLDIYSRLPITDKLLLGFKDNMITQDPNVSGTSSTIFQ